jgi:hypothetical protein
MPKDLKRKKQKYESLEFHQFQFNNRHIGKIALFVSIPNSFVCEP